MDNETKKLLIMQLGKLKALSRMYEHTFRAAGGRMKEADMNALLDGKLKIDRQIEILNKMIEEAEE